MKTHIPVMCAECVDLLRPALSRPGARYLDATTGLGGHLQAMLSAFPALQACAIDRDPQALAHAKERLGEDAARCTFVHTTYDRIPQALEVAGWDGVDGILMDLGVSSMQLDERERGFSYARDAALDMRMDQTSAVTAADILAQADVRELTRILAHYGEERYARAIARRIVQARERGPIATSAQLVALIREALPQAAMRRGGNPAKRTFQALRIAVNDELGILEAALPAALDALRPGGRIVVESYHSLEDRCVKRTFQAACAPTLPPDLPVPEAERGAPFRALTRKARQASAAERDENPRSTSVRLRAIEKCRPSTDKE